MPWKPLEEICGWSPGERPQKKGNFGAISTKAMAEVKEMEELRGEVNRTESRAEVMH